MYQGVYKNGIRNRGQQFGVITIVANSNNDDPSNFVETKLREIQAERISREMEVLNVIDVYFQEVNTDPEERMRRIKSIQEYVSYNERFTALTDEERQDFVYCNEGYPLTDKERALLKSKSKKEQEMYINQWARGTYFRKCAWLEYLMGKTDVKPLMEEIK